MDKINKNGKIIIFSYLLLLIIYSLMAYSSTKFISDWIEIFERKNFEHNIVYYNHLYLSICYFSLSTLAMFKALNIRIYKKLVILIYIISFVLASVAIYKYHSYRYFKNLLALSSCFILGLHGLYRQMNKQNLLNWKALKNILNVISK